MPATPSPTPPFARPLVFSNDSNPNADDDGNYNVNPGDKLPGIPTHAWKFGTQVKATDAWTVGITGIAATGQYLFGDEGNQSQKTSGYCLFNFDTTYQITPRIQLFGSIENMFGAHYETYGTFAPHIGRADRAAPRRRQPARADARRPCQRLRRHTGQVLIDKAPRNSFPRLPETNLRSA